MKKSTIEMRADLPDDVRVMLVGKEEDAVAILALGATLAQERLGWNVLTDMWEEGAYIRNVFGRDFGEFDFMFKGRDNDKDLVMVTTYLLLEVVTAEARFDIRGLIPKCVAVGHAS